MPRVFGMNFALLCIIVMLMTLVDGFAPVRSMARRRSPAVCPAGKPAERGTRVYGARGGGLARRDESRRQSRVSQLIKTEMSQILLTGHGVRSPREIEDGLRRRISVVDVDVSPDLRNCNVYVCVRGSELEKREALSWLVRSTRSLRHVLAHRNRAMKRVPEVLFKAADVTQAVDVMRLIEEANYAEDDWLDEEEETRKAKDYLGLDADEEDLDMYMK